ncbi:MAG: hypothetical protein FD126_1048 [Elusimicrobia bacterium]|nr:MAG: hypothetical protein FD126_1048 [Elusimicrobiota bacterium]
MRNTLPLLLACLLARPDAALAFCGFYVAKADAALYNKASQVVLVRNGDKTVITMANDYKGDPKEFALVVPVPVVLTKADVRVIEPELITALDAYSSPRLVEYFDHDPCRPDPMYLRKGGVMAAVRGSAQNEGGSAAARAKALGVTIEEKFTAGEYDILVLGAKESDGLETWLTENGYKLPKGASKALAPYIKLKHKFFVAKVNLKEKENSGFAKLRPLQFGFKDPRFMLPLRLGMLNADGPQDLLVYAITKEGRVESSNYRTVDVPSDRAIPTYARGEFAKIYPALFEQAWKKYDKRSVLTEYTWDLNWCDPCASEPPTREQLEKLGVWWFPDTPDGAPQGTNKIFLPNRPRRGGGSLEARVTRLHVRYEKETWPEDLVFQETTDRRNFQGRYVLNHRWEGTAACDEAKVYREKTLPEKEEKAVQELSALTGWPAADIRRDWKTARAEGRDKVPPQPAHPWR